MNTERYISAEDLAPFIETRSCRLLGDKYEIESKSGIFKLNLSAFPSVYQCRFHMRRVSGNGKLSIIRNGDVTNTSIGSQKLQYLDVDMDYTDEIILRRPRNSNGNLELLGLTLYSYEEDTVIKHWKEQLAKCKSYRSVRIAKNRLFAAEGGHIEAGQISSIVTSPPNSAVISGSTAKFVSSCEIIELNIDGKKRSPGQPIPFTEMKESAPIANQQGTPTAPPVSVPSVPVKKQPKPKPAEAPKNNVIFDSGKIRFSQGIIIPGTPKFELLNNNNAVRVSHKGGISIPIASIQPGKKYIVVLEVVNIVGNGKVRIFIHSPNGNGIQSLIFAAQQKRAVNIDVNSGEVAPPPGESFRLVIERPESATGDIVISRIMLVEAVGADLPQHNIVLPEYKPNRVSYGLKIESDNLMYMRVKKFSQMIQTDSSIAFDDISGSVTITSVSALSWFNKVGSCLPGVTLNATTDNEHVLLVGDIGNLINADNIFVSEFSDEAELSAEDCRALEGAKHIFSPSPANIDKISKLIHDSNIRLAHKPWPYIPPKPLQHINGKYILLLNRHEHTTKMVIESWDKDLPQIVLVGGRGRYPGFIKPTNEYLPYENLLYLIENALLMIDIPIINGYFSSAQNIAGACKTPIVTSNGYLDGHEFVSVVSAKNNFKTFFVPDMADIIPAIKETLSAQREQSSFSEAYNKYAKEAIRELFV